jgi:hypothetical protein
MSTGEKDEEQPVWKPITQAAKETKISRNKLWKMVGEGKLQAWIAPPWDERLTLVNMRQLQRMKAPETAPEAELEE